MVIIMITNCARWAYSSSLVSRVVPCAEGSRCLGRTGRFLESWEERRGGERERRLCITAIGLCEIDARLRDPFHVAFGADCRGSGFAVSFLLSEGFCELFVSKLIGSISARGQLCSLKRIEHRERKARILV